MPISIVNIRHVAGKAGCPVATVSQVVNGTGPASRSMRERVSAVVAELGFRPSGLDEQQVPFIVSHRLGASWTARAPAGTLRKYDIFDAVLNGVER